MIVIGFNYLCFFAPKESRKKVDGLTQKEREVNIIIKVFDVIIPVN